MVLGATGGQEQQVSEYGFHYQVKRIPTALDLCRGRGGEVRDSDFMVYPTDMFDTAVRSLIDASFLAYH